MPVYDYECQDCGVFTAFLPMEKYADPCGCPSCEKSADRVFLRGPNLSLMDGNRRHGFATNERSADRPKTTRGGGHGPNCSCCSGGDKPSRTLHRPDGSKTFPSARPWMISH